MPTPPQITGLLNIDKPAGLTSHDVVARLRKILSVRDTRPCRQQRRSCRVGHTGTLDPFATGVLLVAIGSATRLIEYSHDWDKEYEAIFVLGASSDTDDITGIKSEIRNPKSETILKSEIRKILKLFTGTYEQLPPTYSAKKIVGERSYKLARKGIKPSLTPCPVTIHNIEIISYVFPDLTLRITCSTGTYIRSLARDLGSALGTGAYVKRLRRTRIGSHEITKSVKLNELENTGIKDYLLPPETLVKHLPQIILTDDNVAQFIQGQTIGEQGTDPDQKYTTNPFHPTATPLSLIKTPSSQPNSQLVSIFNQSSTLLGVAQLDPATHLLHPIKVLSST